MNYQNTRWPSCKNHFDSKKFESQSLSLTFKSAVTARLFSKNRAESGEENLTFRRQIATRKSGPRSTFERMGRFLVVCLNR
jgi:hypothetical protein